MSVFQKVGGWITDKKDRFVRGEAGATGGYYGSSEAEHTYGQMGRGDQEDSERPQEMDQTGRFAPPAPKDYGGGRVPYQSQRDLQEKQAAMEAEQQRLARQDQRGYAQRPMQQNYQGPQQGWQNSYGQPPQGGFQPAPMGYPPNPQQTSNVVPFPGMQKAPDGNIYAHTEYVLLLRSRNECTTIIQYIKTNASVFLDMEFIASDTERQRCVDMLSGAAYTLGCQINRISARGIYLISSPTVYLVVDPALRRAVTTPETSSFVRQSYEGGYGLGRQSTGGYAGQGFSAAGQTGEPPRPRFGQTQGYDTGNSPQRMGRSFGDVMAGEGSGSYPGASGFQAGNTGRFPKKGFQ